MIDITHKSETHRKAIARAIVSAGNEDTMLAVKNNTVPKGNVLESARVAALFAAKKTHEMIPDCHPIPIEKTLVSFTFLDAKKIEIRVEAETIYKTGIEVEVMHAASVAALTVYDMLKPIDDEICIQEIKLVNKSGGKSDYTLQSPEGIKARVIVCSDTIFAGKKEDRAGKEIAGILEKTGVIVSSVKVIPDEAIEIEKCVSEAEKEPLNLLVFTGGTGLSPRDITTETIKPMLTRHIPGVEEAMRTYGQKRTPYAMLSRSVAGYYHKLLVLALPGSSRGAVESMNAVFPALLHLFEVEKGTRHKA